MLQTRRTILVQAIIAIVLVISVSIPYIMSANAQNSNLSDGFNDKRMIVDLKNRTITLINGTTNETISVKNLTTIAGNVTANQNLTVDAGNLTTN